MANTTITKYADGVFGTDNVSTEKFAGNNRATIVGDRITIKTDTGLVLFTDVQIGGGSDRLLIEDQTTSTSYDPSTPLEAISVLSSVGFFANASTTVFTVAGATDTNFSSLADNNIMQYDSGTGQWENRSSLTIGSNLSVAENLINNSGELVVNAVSMLTLSTGDASVEITDSFSFTGQVVGNTLVRSLGRLRVGDNMDTPAAGEIRYNSTTNRHQGYNGTTWEDFYT